MNLTPELMLMQQGRDAHKAALNPAAMRVYQQVAERARALVDPVALLDIFNARALEADRLVLSNGQAFQSHLVIEQLAHVQQIMVAICTIGSRIESESRRAFAEGNGLAGFLYDSAGTVAVGFVAAAVIEHMEKLAQDRGLKASFAIAPGSADCTLEDQRVVFSLLPAETIGVRLTDHCVMVPGKSVSLLVGLGLNVPTRHELAQCDFCPRKDTCPSAPLRKGHSFDKS